MPGEALERLRRHARKRLPAPHHPILDEARRAVGRLRDDELLAPEDMSLGYHTPLWAELSEEERLVCNHWAYLLQYARIVEGEEYVIRANAVVAEAVREREPAVADLLAREADEEVDHVAAFRAVRDRVLERCGLRRLPGHQKPARALLLHPATIRWLVRTWGAEFVTAYYTARGIANHMGKAFEAPIARMAGKNRPFHRLSELHAIDESQHMAVSHFMAACARELVPGPRGPLGRSSSRLMQRVLVAYTFSDRTCKGHERALTWSAVRRMPALRRRPRGFLRDLVAAHYTTPHGIERRRNATMPRLNQRLIDAAALDPETRSMWRRTLVEKQGNLRFLPEPEVAR